MSAAEFTSRLLELESDQERDKLLRYFKTGDGDYAEQDTFVGVRMGEVFRLAKAFIDCPAGSRSRCTAGRIVEAWNIYDGVSQLKQLGAILEPVLPPPCPRSHTPCRFEVALVRGP